MKFDANTHIYCQIINDIKKKAVRGELQPGEKLPSVRSLAELYQINPNTAARIYREMESQGLSFTRKGQGTYLTADASLFRNMKSEMALQCLSDFISEMHEIDYTDEEICRLILGSLGPKKDT